MTKRKFKLASDELEDDLKKKDELKVFEKGSSPTIDFQLLGDRKAFLRYAHLLHGELTDEDNQKIVKLLYSTHTVIIKGYCLQEIYDLIKTDSLASVRANDKRYMNTVEDSHPYVTEIEIFDRTSNREEPN